MPSVRGRQKLLVGWLFIISGTTSGAFFGFVLSLPLLFTPELGLRAVATTIGIGVALDLLRLLRGRPNPPASGRQVPQEWSRLLAPEAVAVLYGARLGIGPLTILSTWTWWSVTVAAALTGPGTGAAVGATFGFVRLAVTIVASVLASRTGDPSAHTAWFGRLRMKQTSNWAALNGAGLFLMVAVMLAGCGANNRSAAFPAEVSETTAITVAPVASTATTATTTLAESTTTSLVAGTESPAAEAVSEPTPPTIPVRLEDVVRTAIDPQANTNSETAAPMPTAAGLNEGSETQAASQPTPAAFGTAPADLAAALPETLAGFSMIENPEADRYLDLAAASAIQPDPTEEVALLETRGFAGGWTRAFRNDTNDVAVVSVYHFEDAAEAEFYLEDGLITIGGYGGKFFDIPALPGVRGFVQYFTETEADGAEELVSLGAAFQLGPRWHLVYLVGSVETVTPEVLIPAVQSLTSAAAQA